MNVPRTIATVVSLRLATLHECWTVYGLKDLHDMIEIAAVDSYNKRLLSKPA